MVSDLLWLLAILAALFWIVLPAAVLVMAVFYKGDKPAGPAGGEQERAPG